MPWSRTPAPLGFKTAHPDQPCTTRFRIYGQIPTKLCTCALGNGDGSAEEGKAKDKGEASWKCATSSGRSSLLLHVDHDETVTG